MTREVKRRRRLLDFLLFSFFFRAGIFSRWDCSGKPSQYIKMEERGTCEIGDYEGDFVSARCPFVWTQGKFVCELRVVEKLKDHVWVSFCINGAQIGRLRFDGVKLKIDRNSVCSFVEIYGDNIPISKIPPGRFSFENLRVNGAPVEIMRRFVVFPEDAPSVANAIRQENGGVAVMIGPEYVPHDENELDL